jgi:Saxitoxin biosynthesis operon protein SxtJ
VSEQENFTSSADVNLYSILCVTILSALGNSVVKTSCQSEADSECQGASVCMSDTSPLRYSSEWRFGITLTIAFLGLALLEAIKHHNRVAAGLCLLISAAMVALTVFNSRMLTPLLRVWLLLGERIGKIVNPVALGIIFFGIVTPIAVFARCLGRDELRLKRPPTDSYWRVRSSPDSAAVSFKRQF